MVGLMTLVFYVAAMLLSALIARKKSLRFQVFLHATVGLAVALTAYHLAKPGFSFKPSFKMWWLFLAILILEVFTVEERDVGFYPVGDPVFSIVAVSVYPISEELIFRGILLGELPSPILNGLIFALFHLINLIGLERFSTIRLVLTFAMGFTLALSVLRSGSLFPAILYHVVNNALAIALYRR